MNGQLSAAALIAEHGDRVACVVADSAHYSQWTTVMFQSSMVNRTSPFLFTICVLSLFLSTGCAFSKNLLGKSSLQNPALPAQTVTGSGVASPDCAVPNTQSKPTELTAYPVMPQTAAQATGTANAAPVTNGTPQPPVMQQPATQQQPYVQQQPVQQPPYVQQPPAVQQLPPAAPQQSSAFVQPPAQPLLAQPTAQAAVMGVATQGYGQSAQEQSNQPQAVSPQAGPAGLVAIAPAQSQSVDPNVGILPAATISARPNHPKEACGPEMTAAPASALQAPARSGATASATCPPGMVPSYGYLTDSISPPEKLAECEKQVFEMSQKLSELQLDTRNAKLTMDQMAEQQKRLLIDNELLRRRAEMADRRYLEELDSLSEIVGEVVTQAGTVSKSSSASKPSRNASPQRPVPQSTTGQTL